MVQFWLNQFGLLKAKPVKPWAVQEFSNLNLIDPQTGLGPNKLGLNWFGNRFDKGQAELNQAQID